MEVTHGSVPIRDASIRDAALDLDRDEPASPVAADRRHGERARGVERGLRQRHDGQRTNAALRALGFDPRNTDQSTSGFKSSQRTGLPRLTVSRSIDGQCLAGTALAAIQCSTF